MVLPRLAEQTGRNDEMADDTKEVGNIPLVLQVHKNRRFTQALGDIQRDEGRSNAKEVKKEKKKKGKQA